MARIQASNSESKSFCTNEALNIHIISDPGTSDYKSLCKQISVITDQGQDVFESAGDQVIS